MPDTPPPVNPSQTEWVPKPDPTLLTTEAVARARVDIERIMASQLDGLRLWLDTKFEHVEEKLGWRDLQHAEFKTDLAKDMDGLRVDLAKKLDITRYTLVEKIVFGAIVTVMLAVLTAILVLVIAPAAIAP